MCLAVLAEQDIVMIVTITTIITITIIIMNTMNIVITTIITIVVYYYHYHIHVPGGPRRAGYVHVVCIYTYVRLCYMYCDNITLNCHLSFVLC